MNEAAYHSILRRLGVEPAATPEPAEVARVLGLLDPVTLRDALGSDPDPVALAALEAEVLAAVASVESEILTGALGSGVALVRGRPLADWLPLEDLARMLRRVPWRSEAGAPCYACDGRWRSPGRGAWCAACAHPPAPGAEAEAAP